MEKPTCNSNTKNGEICQLGVSVKCIKCLKGYCSRHYDNHICIQEQGGNRIDHLRRRQRENETPIEQPVPPNSVLDEIAEDIKQDREANNTIPFQGSSSISAWAGGIPPNAMFKTRIIDSEIAKKYLPEGKNWEIIKWDKIPIREAPNLTIPEWAKMGFWGKDQFAMLYALSARVPDFSLASYWNVVDSEIALIIQKEDEIFIEVANGSSKRKAKEAVAIKINKSAKIWEWLNAKHGETLCDKHLKQ